MDSSTVVLLIVVSWLVLAVLVAYGLGWLINRRDRHDR